MRVPPMQRRDDRPAGERCDITLRDTFAAAALTGLLSNVPRYQLGPLTEQAFQIADEMIKQSSRAADDREMLSEFQKFVQEEKKKMDDDPIDFQKKILTKEERDAIHDGMYCLNVYCDARQGGDVLAVKLRGAVETLRSLLERLA